MKVAMISPDYGGFCSTANKMTNGSDRLWLKENGHEELVFAIDAVDIASVRNKALEQAIRQNCDRLLMVDSDVGMEGGNSSLQWLMPTMTEHDAAVAGVPVMLRRAEVLPNGQHKNTVNCSPIYAGQVYQGRVATGIMLIDVKKAAELDKPYFLDVRNDDNTQRTTTQDMYFCDKLKQRGYKVYVDFRAGTVHTARPLYSTTQLIRDRFSTFTSDTTNR